MAFGNKAISSYHKLKKPLEQSLNDWLTDVPELSGIVRPPRFIETLQSLIYFNYRNSLYTVVLTVKITMHV